MGNSSSAAGGGDGGGAAGGEGVSLLERGKRREHVPPRLREERRYLAHEGGHGTDAAAVDQSVDKYDYLIVFPLSEGEGVEFEGADEWINWKTATEIWYQCVPGDDEMREKAKEHLARKWRERVGSIEPEDGDQVTMATWITIARETIVEQLTNASGLQMTNTVQGDKVCCRIRAPIKLLERQAEIEGYRLQFKPEVDPGTDFWDHDEEIEEEQRELTRDEANETLERLYQHNKIGPNDLAVFESEATAKQWSRRVHTLERIADRVYVSNDFPAYASFSRDPKLRHLFNTYPSVRRRTLFRAKDRLYLTKAIIDSHFIIEVLEIRGVVEGIMALHDANRGDAITVEVLQKRWVQFWRASPLRVGAPFITHPSMDPNKPLPWYLRAFSQPLNDIRDYFGEKLALYFAWLGFYTYALVFPAIVGLANEVYIVIHGSTDGQVGLDYIQLCMALIVILWTVVYKEAWDREQMALATRWGTTGFEEAEKDRPQFEGDEMKRSPVTNMMEMYFPEEQRTFRQVSSVSIIVVFIALLLGAVQLVFYLEYTLEDYWWGSPVCSLISAAQIQLLSFIYGSIVVELNDWENHRTETAYEDNLIFKTFLFQMFNNYAALFYTAFLKGSMFGCTGSCIYDLRQLLISIFAVRFLMNVQELGLPLAKQMLAKSEGEEQEAASAAAAASAAENGEGGAGGAEADPLQVQEREPWVDEIYLEEYEGTFDDYAEIVLQYGYITMFVTALPATLTLAIVENVLEIRVDAYKMCKLVRRPHPLLAEDVGMWSNLIEAMSLLAILTNTGIICFTTGHLSNFDLDQRFLIFLAAEQLVIILKILLHMLIPDEPDWLADVLARNQFIIQKHVVGFVDEGADEDGGRDYMDVEAGVDGVTLSDFKKDKKLNRRDKEHIHQLEAQRREIARELKIVKEQLQTAYRSEVFNEQTGIGETRHGLPLGCLKFTLVEVEGLDARPEDTTVVISLRSTKAGDKSAPGPPPEVSRPGSAGGRNNRALAFNQAFIMAPVRTQDAEIVFDIMDKTAEPKKRGTTSLHLRELANQQEHDLPLPVKIRGRDGTMHTSDARLYVKLHFGYSKIVPLRTKIYQLQDQQRQVEKELAHKKVGRS